MNSATPVQIAYQPCESSQIHSFGYHAASRTLGVKFHSKGKTMAEPAPPSEYFYFSVGQETVDAFAAAESKGTAFAKLVRGKFRYERQPDADGIVFGLTQKQEPKYTTSSKDGRIVNRSTGIAIPDDEPVIILRAQDRRALPILRAYAASCENADHRAVMRMRICDFEDFAAQHPERMKEPDASLQDVCGADLSRGAPTVAAISADVGGSGVERVWNGPVTAGGATEA